MNKKLLFAALAILLIVGAGIAYALLQKDTKTGPNETTAENTEAQLNQNPQSNPQSAEKGKYVDYIADSFASTKGTKLLFFHAPWCPQCRALDESIKASELPSGLTVFKVDYDSNQQLRAQYGVTIQTTIVKTDEEGNKISSYVAYEEPTFQSVKQALLP